MLAPSEALTRLVCSFCNNYLSVFPIHYENEQKTYMCGRCPLITSLNPVRQLAYEELAKFMKFPCKYQESGCLESYVPYNLMKHEDSCKHRPYYCPFLPLGDCPWQGRQDELYEHFSDSHKQYVLNNLELELDIVNNYEEHYIFIHEDNTFMAYLKCNVDRDEFCCCIKNLVSSAEEEQSYKYSIKLCNNQGESYDFEAHPVQTNATDIVDRAKATYIDICNIKLALHNPNCILLKIKIFKPENNESNLTGLNKFQEEMLRNIECPVCMEHMTAPILQCNTGHSICERCRSGRTECPTCRGPIGNTRNFSLEEFTHFIMYPCKYREYGCPFTSKSSEIRKHEAECKLGPFECPIEECTWKNKLSSLLQHVKLSHEDNFLDLNEVTFIYSSGLDEDDTYITSAYGDIFKLYFYYRNFEFFWAMQTIGATQTSYMFEVDIDSGNSSERFFARKVCSSLTVNEDALNDGQSYIQFSEDMLKNMVKEETLTYTFRITKKEI